MKKRKKFWTFHPIDYSKHLTEVTPPRAPTQRQLYNLVYSFGVNGCWMSNATIGKLLHRSRRSIQIARGQLATSEAIILARCNPRTFSMWASKHPAVNSTKELYFKGGKIPNPFYSQSGAPLSGAQKRRPGGAKTAPKREEYTPLTEYIHSGDALDGGRPAAGKQSRDRDSVPAKDGGSVKPEKLNAFEVTLLDRHCSKLTAHETTLLLHDWRWRPEKIPLALERLFGD